MTPVTRYDLVREALATWRTYPDPDGTVPTPPSKPAPPR